MKPILSFRELQKEAKSINSGSTEIKVAVLGNHTTTFFTKALKSQLIVNGYLPEIFESDYDQIDITIIDDESSLYEFDRELIIIFESTLKLLEKFYALKNNQLRSEFFKDIKELTQNRISALRSNKSKAKIIYFSYELSDDHLYGHLFSKIPH